MQQRVIKSQQVHKEYIVKISKKVGVHTRGIIVIKTCRSFLFLAESIRYKSQCGNRADMYKSKSGITGHTDAGQCCYRTDR